MFGTNTTKKKSTLGLQEVGSWEVLLFIFDERVFSFFLKMNVSFGLCLCVVLGVTWILGNNKKKTQTSSHGHWGHKTSSHWGHSYSLNLINCAHTTHTQQFFFVFKKKVKKKKIKPGGPPNPRPIIGGIPGGIPGGAALPPGGPPGPPAGGVG